MVLLINKGLADGAATILAEWDVDAAETADGPTVDLLNVDKSASTFRAAERAPWYVASCPRAPTQRHAANR